MVLSFQIFIYKVFYKDNFTTLGWQSIHSVVTKAPMTQALTHGVSLT